MKNVTTSRKGADQAYDELQKLDVGALIDELKLSSLRKQMLKSRWLDQVTWAANRARSARNWYYSLRLTAIIGGILIPISVMVGQIESVRWMSWVATGLGALVSIAVAIEEFFDYGERWRHFRSTAELLKSEGWQFFQLSGAYSRRKSHNDAYEKFATRVEEIIQSDVQVYISKIVRDREPEEEEEQSKGEDEAND